MRSRATIAALALLVCAGLTSASALDNYEHQIWRTENGLPQNSVHSIAQTADGYIWFATEGGLARFDGLKFSVFDADNTPALCSSSIRSLLVSDDQSLWIATADGLSRLTRGSFTCLTTQQGLPSNNVVSVFRDTDGSVAVLTTAGSAAYRQGRFIRKSISQPQSEVAINGSVRSWLRGKRVTAALHESSGATWVGTDSGAARIVNGEIDPLQSPESIARGFILSIFADREGDIWIGTDSDGVTVLRDRRFQTFGRDQGFPDALVRCVFEDSRGTLWAGTNGQGLRRLNGESFSNFTTADGLSSDVILSLADDGRGGLFIGTPDGLNILRNGHIQILTSADGLPDDFIRSIYKDLDGSIWMGTRHGLVHYASGRLSIYSSRDGLPSDLVGAVLRDRNGCLWVGTLKGLACLNHNRIAQPAFLAGIRDAAITSLYEDAAGALWIGTEGRGLVRLAGQRAFQFPASVGLPNNVPGLTEDSHGYLWLESQRGLFRASKHALDGYAEHRDPTVSVAVYGTLDGLPVDEFSTGGHPTIWRDRRDTIWFASGKGLLSIDSVHSEPNRLSPGIVIERVSADDRVLNPSRVRSLGPGISRLAFEYTGLSFRAPQRIRFSYRLEGFDKHWIDAGTRRAAYYTNLPPGKYLFRVLARNNDGFWNAQAADFAFDLLPRFYQTNWFRALIALFLSAFAYALYRWRMHHVRTELNAVMAERNRIAREIHDTLAQGFVGISVQLELVRRLMSTSREAAEQVLRQAHDLAQNSLAEARRSIWNLRSESGSDADLRSKLSKTVEQSVRNHDVNVSVQVTGAYRPLPARIETEVLRIGQEAVVNAVRHANATRLDVTLAFDSHKAQMTIRDDGKGFTPGENDGGADGHFGLRGMRERAEAIDAKLSVITAAGKGTQVCLELPLK